MATTSNVSANLQVCFLFTTKSINHYHVCSKINPTEFFQHMDTNLFEKIGCQALNYKNIIRITTKLTNHTLFG